MTSLLSASALMNAAVVEEDIRRVPTLNVLNMSLDRATEALHDYTADVARTLNGWSMARVEAAFDALLRPFLAINWGGDLNECERQAIAPTVDHFQDPRCWAAMNHHRGGDDDDDDDDATAVSCASHMRTSSLAGCTMITDAVNTPLAPAITIEIERRFRYLLQLDGESTHPRVRYPALLVAALAVAKAALPSQHIYHLRAARYHQQCLRQPCHTLYRAITSFADHRTAMHSDASVRNDPRLLVEVGLALLLYHRSEEAAKFFFAAAKKSGLQLEETEVLGVRTRWQETAYAQHLLCARSARAPSPVDVGYTDGSLPLPHVILREAAGHDLYDRPRASVDAPALSTTPLTTVDAAIILALAHDLRNSNPSHGLTTHHVQVYLERLLVDSAPKVYPVFACVLLNVCRLELRRNRVQERSYLQLQAFVDDIRLPSRWGGGGGDDHAASAPSSDIGPCPPTAHRTDPRYLHSVMWPTIWALETEFANESCNQNLYKTALEIYERVQDWHKVIFCCQQLDRRKKAESLLRDLIAKDPSDPVLYCALGDATRDESQLWKAWEISGKRCPAAMRSLARLAMERQEYRKVMEYFETAIALNPTFGGDWFSYGYAAMKLDINERAAEAFTRVCQNDPDDPFAWTNLGSVLLKLGRKRPALNALSQAVRNNRSVWRMWDNYFGVALELLEVSEATNALITAVTLAGRTYQVDRVRFASFSDALCRCLRGELSTSGNIAVTPTDLTDGVAALKGVRLADEDELPAEGAGDASTDEDFSGFQALMVDMEDWNRTDGAALPLNGDAGASSLPRQGVSHAEGKQRDEANRHQRLVERTEQLLELLESTFVSSAPVFALLGDVAAALLHYWRHTTRQTAASPLPPAAPSSVAPSPPEGAGGATTTAAIAPRGVAAEEGGGGAAGYALKAFVWYGKAVRECKQLAGWERSPEPYRAVVDALQRQTDFFVSWTSLSMVQSPLPPPPPTAVTAVGDGAPPPTRTPNDNGEQEPTDRQNAVEVRVRLAAGKDLLTSLDGVLSAASEDIVDTTAATDYRRNVAMRQTVAKVMASLKGVTV